MNLFTPFASRFFSGKKRDAMLSKRSAAGFTMLELLLVVGIMAVLSSIALLSIAGMKGATNMTKAAYDIQGALEQARTVAMATGTYTWVGFFEETDGAPGVAGTGQVVISVVSSTDGTRLNVVTNPSAATSITPAGLTQVAKLLRIANVHLDTLSAAAITRPAVTATYQLASSSFPNFYTFGFPLTGTATYTFKNIIQFSPQGDATRIGDTPTQVIEIGLRPTHGGAIATSSTDVAAIQVSGISGRIATYRP